MVIYCTTGTLILFEFCQLVTYFLVLYKESQQQLSNQLSTHNILYILFLQQQIKETTKQVLVLTYL